MSENLMMNLLDLAKDSVTTAAVLGVIGFLFRGPLSRWLEAMFSERTQKRLAEFQAQIAKDQSEMSDLRQFVFSGQLRRNEALLEKQIQSAEALWGALIQNKRHRLTVDMMRTINIDKMNEVLNSGRHSEFVDGVSKMSGLDAFIEEAKSEKTEDERKTSRAAELSRPFISPLAWAYYSASTSITMHAVVTLFAWKNGVDTLVLKNAELLEQVTRALPHQKEFLKEHGVGGTYFLVSELEEKLLAELRRFIRDGETSQELVEQATGILAVSAK
ncbi:hypothetical protein PhaeoP54_02291 [Phaeobacter inhibens]|nr:hypothetical protein PhaeoP54_02291 [Phaeobacter inhibens]